MSELKEHLYFLLEDNIEYNPAFDIFKAEDDFEDTNTWAEEVDDNVIDIDEDFIIDVLVETDNPILIYSSCITLMAVGTAYALPALLWKEKAAAPHIQAEIRTTIDAIQTRTEITAEQISVINSTGFSQIRWNKSALTFFCIFNVITMSLGVDIEDQETEALGDFLIGELGVNMDGFHSIRDFRICHMETDAYFNEMIRYDKLLRSEREVRDILTGTEIEESQESELKEFYTELMTEFLNIQVVKAFGKNF
ncbi:hypothetical protein [Mucilaginibacter paludis]|uniref:Uncharacterized protein n=1 Tax=Mucilaginibacter paludis DSM 18603 TaxID=714943 RepID=H1XZ74_9SPHI|nr:hypothetical protein [Mucilaginibacter paludis]EHQ24659.1 hypothetical protein Mucpa_0465 [Mucilaginibacter paludis DSM 18603]